MAHVGAMIGPLGQSLEHTSKQGSEKGEGMTLSLSSAHQREDRKEESDDEARDQFHRPVSSPPTRETIVPQSGQELLTVGLGHELRRRRR